MEFGLAIDSPFSLEYTLESGQVFRWENRGEWWYGVLSGGVIKAKQEGDYLRCISSSDSINGDFVRSYFKLDDALQPILSSVMKDDVIIAAVQRFYGLRIIGQDFWECLASFVLATNSNIPRIKKMVQSICSRFGAPIEFEGLEYRGFPMPGAIADASVSELRECGLGYRAPFLKRVAETVVQGKIDGGEISLMSYEEAQRALLKIIFGEKVLLGVGPKVADCVLLYSCGKNEAFPIDVWIARELTRSYPDFFSAHLLKKLSRNAKVKLTGGDYLSISAAARSYFGAYAGYAQQYLFMMAREKS
jgi:N-glycosylase/DNA lyase